MNGALGLLSTALVLSSCQGGVPPAPETGQTTGKTPGITTAPIAAGSPDSRPLVLTTFTVLADMARQVAGESLRVESITKLGAEIHGYEPTPSDLKRAQDAKLILDNGFGLERWADRFYAGLRGVPRVTLTKGIDPLPITEDADRGKPNPHAWMSPRLAEIYVENIQNAFSRLDPTNAAQYRRNADAYRVHLRQLDRELRDAVATIPAQKRMLASCEGAFSYLARDYGLEEAYLWPVNAESQITPQRMGRLIDLIRTRKVPAVFCESTVSDEAQRQVARESGARFAGVFYVDSLSLPGGPAATLLDLQRHNVRTLVSGLKGG